jgi:hypothetical protein
LAIKLKELEDFAWFPKRLRKMQVDYIGWLVAAFKVYVKPVEILAQKLAELNKSELIDLASGNGAPVQFVAERIQDKNLTFLLTDRYPAFGNITDPRIRVQTSSFDVLKEQGKPNCFYTMFNAFHHFDKRQQLELMKNYGKSGFMVFEILRPTLLDFIKILITTTILQLIFTPFVKPFNLLRLLLTYIVPINLITITYDGLVSVLKSLSKKHYLELIKNLDAETYTCEYIESGTWYAPVSILYVKPKPND